MINNDCLETPFWLNTWAKSTRIMGFARAACWSQVPVVPFSPFRPTWPSSATSTTSAESHGLMEVFNQAVPIYLDEQTRMIRYLAWEHVGTCLDWDDHTQICLMANCAAVPFYDILAEDALGYDLECPPLIVLDCHPQQLGTSLTFITWLAQGCARTHTQ